VVVGLVDVVSSVVVVLVCANANGATSPQTKAMIVLFTLMPPFDLVLLPQFVTQAPSGRSLCIISSSAWYCGDSLFFAHFIDLSGHREFGNMGCQ
jgi:hypothetical protein